MMWEHPREAASVGAALAPTHRVGGTWCSSLTQSGITSPSIVAGVLKIRARETE